LDPLGQVIGLTKSKINLWKSCQNDSERNRLQELGCHLGIIEWTEHFEQRCSLSTKSLEAFLAENTEVVFDDDVRKKDEVRL